MSAYTCTVFINGKVDELHLISAIISKRHSYCRTSQFYLALIWCISLSIGACLAFRFRDNIVSLMYLIPTCHLSIISLGLIALMPLLFICVAIILSVPEVVYIFAFFDSVSFAFTLVSALLAYSSAGWLVFFLISFSRTVLLVPRLYFYMRCFTKEKNVLIDIIYVLAIAILICFVDYFVVSQFMQQLIFCH